MAITSSDRFWAKVEKTETCWLWTGSRIQDWKKEHLAYGSFRVGGRGGRSVLAHRYAYEMLIGPIPDGHDLHHMCEIAHCVNPRHLVPLTRAWHMAQHWGTHCKRGHEMDEANTYYPPQRGRRCRKCSALRQRSYPRWKLSA